VLLSRTFPAFRQRKPTVGVLLSFDKEISMIRKRLIQLGLAVAFAVGQPVLAASTDEPGKHDTGKGAAAGAVIGHEVGHGHAGAGAATGALIGHHEKNKAEERAEKRQ
jgi:hypothetical protein